MLLYKRFLVFLGTALLLLLAACGTAPEKNTNPKSGRLSAEALLAKADSQESPAKESLLMDAAQAYIDRQELKKAKRLLRKVDQDIPQINVFAKRTAIAAQLALLDENLQAADDILSNPRLEQQWQDISLSSEKRLRALRAETYDRLGKIYASVNERIQLGVILTDKKSDTNNQQLLWKSLLKLSFSELTQMANSTHAEVEQGWYSLAAIAKNHQVDLETQRELLQDWLRTWRRHPARQQLPSDIKLIQEIMLNQPKKIALILPQSGKLAEAGQALVDGFFAAYFQSLQKSHRVPEIQLYDSTGDIVQTYQQAVDEGAEFVIGPIEKEKVSELSLLPSFPVPLLALNYVDQSLPIAANYYQFGLAIEDEARQVARQAYAEGKRQAMLIIPPQDWSQRSAAAFTQEWESLGGVIVNRSQFYPNMNFSNLIKEVMLIESSLIRTRQLETFLSTSLESVPHSRGDVDMIFLIADPVQARQIKPMFAYHYAGDIPIFSTSQIYSGTANPQADRDLNGVRFNTMPWLFDSQSAEKQVIGAYTNSASVYGRLHALGVDSYRLYMRLPQMAKSLDMKTNGATGSLKLLSNGRIEREQIWAGFYSGQARAIPMVVDQESEGDGE